MSKIINRRFAFTLILATFYQCSCNKISYHIPSNGELTTVVRGVTTKLTITNVSSPAAPAPPNTIANITDGNLNTAWSGENDSSGSQTITFRLDTTQMQSVEYIKIAFYINSPTRISNFDVAVSPDGVTGWVTVLKGGNSMRNITALQTFDFPDTKGKYVRITGHGNTNPSYPTWNTYTEVEIYGQTAESSRASKQLVQAVLVGANQYNAPYVPANVVDGDLNTHWTGQMSDSSDYKYVTLNLDNLDTLDNVKISFYNAGDAIRQTQFSIAISTDSVNWTTVLWKSWSAPNITALETFDFPDVVAQYVRVTCYGHTGTTSPFFYNSLNEVEIWGTPIGTLTTVADWETGDSSQWYETKGHSLATQYHTVTSPVRQGLFAGQFIVHVNDTIVGISGERVESSMWDNRTWALPYITYSEEVPGDDFYYGWSTLFPVGWKAPQLFGIILQQQVRAANTNPAIAINARGDSLMVDFRTGVLARNGSGHTFSFNRTPVILSTLDKGLWHDFIMHIKYKPDSTGSCEIWHRLEGTPKFTKILPYATVPTEQWTTDTATFLSHQPYTTYVKGGITGWVPNCYVRMGLYRDKGGMYTNTVYHDNWCRGTNYSVVRARFK
jgi:hypothetical protein